MQIIWESDINYPSGGLVYFLRFKNEHLNGQ